MKCTIPKNTSLIAVSLCKSNMHLIDSYECDLPRDPCWLIPLNLLNSRGKKFARRLNRGTKDTEYPEDELSLDDTPPELLPIRNERSSLERNKIVNHLTIWVYCV